MYNINFQGLAQASAYELQIPILNGDTEPPSAFTSIDDAKFSIESKGITLTLGSGISFVNSTLIVTLTNSNTAALSTPVMYELWIKKGADNIAVIRGTLEFTATKVRI